jgi:hypothetical protein
MITVNINQAPYKVLDTVKKVELGTITPCPEGFKCKGTYFDVVLSDLFGAIDLFTPANPQP